MIKKLIYIAGIFISFWIGAFVACVGYANGSEEKRNKWDKTFRC